jgi:amidase
MPLRIPDSQVIYAFDRAVPPVAQIDPGDEVVFDTLDTSSGFIKSREDVARYAHVRRADRVNPATGPVWISGAEPGDELQVHIRDIQLTSPGFVRILTMMGLLHGEVEAPQAIMAQVEGTRLRLDIGLEIPLRPMVGVIGTAPAGEPVGTLYPGPHGGNMDLKECRPGATVHLPVYVPGALLALGDVHANMGDAEATGTGVEICASVAVRVSLVKGAARARPWLTLPDAWVSYGHAMALEEALRMATRDMTGILGAQLGVSKEVAYMLIGACGDVGIGQACAGEIERTARVVMPRLAPLPAASADG